MTYCHISTQCDKYAEEECRKQALDDEIERVADELYYQLPEWVRSWIDGDEDFIVNEAKFIIEKRSKEYYE